MNYFTSKKIVTEYTTLTLKPEEANKSFLYFEDDTQYWGIDTSLTVAEFLARQYVECEVKEVTYEQIEDKIKMGHIYKDVKEIKEKYNVDLFEQFGMRE